MVGDIIIAFFHNLLFAIETVYIFPNLYCYSNLNVFVAYAKSQLKKANQLDRIFDVYFSLKGTAREKGIKRRVTSTTALPKH